MCICICVGQQTLNHAYVLTFLLPIDQLIFLIAAAFFVYSPQEVCQFQTDTLSSYYLLIILLMCLCQINWKLIMFVAVNGHIPIKIFIVLLLWKHLFLFVWIQWYPVTVLLRRRSLLSMQDPATDTKVGLSYSPVSDEIWSNNPMTLHMPPAPSSSSSIMFYLSCWNQIVACFIGLVLQQHV